MIGRVHFFIPSSPLLPPQPNKSGRLFELAELRYRHDLGEVAAQQGVATGGAGKTFCAELAKTAGCDVIASAATQYVNVGFYLRGAPWGGCIDDYEGLTYRFRRAGISTTSRNPS